VLHKRLIRFRSEIQWMFISCLNPTEPKMNLFGLYLYCFIFSLSTSKHLRSSGDWQREWSCRAMGVSESRDLYLVPASQSSLVKSYISYLVFLCFTLPPV